ncbi:hypothetical protein CYMTET_47624 [Cymbomonas tetramitiformis]|uniref:Uncharacterized protein n=1 Tax=Cymbomonas tetramitiformis TaxID=36881 RepID=A0AAE0EVT1_9CHLO|nr:hypothetical protein CYMTET_47624 [Cymbomonas tetramitiformis]
MDSTAPYPSGFDPSKPTIIKAVENKPGNFTGKEVTVYLWLDIRGLKIIDANKKTVQWIARLNTIVDWSVENDYLWCRMLYKKGEQRERSFLTGNAKALEFKGALEAFAHLIVVDHLLLAQHRESGWDPVLGEKLSDGMISKEQYTEFDPSWFLDVELAKYFKDQAAKPYRRLPSPLRAIRLPSPRSSRPPSPSRTSAEPSPAFHIPGQKVGQCTPSSLDNPRASGGAVLYYVS